MSPVGRARPAIVAHRGDSYRFRENTLPAFRSAIEIGIERVELDIRTTRDGRSIVVHDETLLRMWGRPVRPDALPYNEIAALGFSDVRVPLLAEALDLLEGTGTGVMIDTGDPATIDAAMATVQERPRDLEIHWCGAVSAMLRVRELDPDAVIHYNLETEALDDEILAILQPQWLNVDGTLMSTDLVAAAHATGLRVSVWTIDDPSAMRALAAYGVDSITTNRPRLALEVLSEEPQSNPSPWPREAKVAGDLAQWAMAYIRGSALGEVTTKAHSADVLTEVDLAVESQVRRTIAEQLPGQVVVGEEEGGTPVAGAPCWYLDPVDGTTNLASGLPWNSFSLALAIDQEPCVATVADPWRGEVMTASRGGGAFVGGRRATTSAATSVSGGTVLFEWLAHVPFAGMMALIEHLAERHVTARIMGSGTLTVASVAAGRTLGAVIGQFNPIDHLAAILLTHEAGGVIRDHEGRDTLWPTGGPFLAAAPGVADELTEAFLSVRARA